MEDCTVHSWGHRELNYFSNWSDRLGRPIVFWANQSWEQFLHLVGFGTKLGTNLVPRALCAEGGGEGTNTIWNTIWKNDDNHDLSYQKALIAIILSCKLPGYMALGPHDESVKRAGFILCSLLKSTYKMERTMLHSSATSTTYSTRLVYSLSVNRQCGVIPVFKRVSKKTSEWRLHDLYKTGIVPVLFCSLSKLVHNYTFRNMTFILSVNIRWHHDLA